MKIAAALAALGLALLTEPIVQESEAPTPAEGEESIAQESGPFTADTPIEDVQSWIDELGL